MKLAHNNLPVPELQADSQLNQAAPVQNTWYTVLDTSAWVEDSVVCVLISTVGEDLEFRATIDGRVISGSQAGAVADTNYWLYLLCTAGGGAALVATTASYYRSRIRGRSVKVEVRKTTANGAGALRGTVTRWRAIP